MLSKTKAIILILAFCGFLIWYQYGHHRKPSDQTDVQVQDTQQPITVKTEEAVRQHAAEPAVTEKKDLAIDLKNKKTVVSHGRKKATDENANGDTWASFRQDKLPEYVEKLQTIFHHEVKLEVDWGSLGNLAQQPHLYENLEYDLNVLIKTFAGQWNPYADPRSKINREKIREGISKISIRKVRGLEKRRLEVKDTVMLMDFSWERHGLFSAWEIETLLLDRDRMQFSRWVNAPECELPPLMKEAYRNRLPVLFRDLDLALGFPITLQIDWSSLNTAPDAAYRLVYLMNTLNQTLKNLVNTDLGFGPRSKRTRMLEKQRVKERSAIVQDNIKTLRIRGGSYETDPVIRFDAGSLELVIFQDEAFNQDPVSDKRKHKPVTHIRRFPNCSQKGLQALITEDLDLEAGPFFRQVKAVFFPMTQSYMPEFFDQLIAKTPLKVREKAELREFLTTHRIVLEVDWDSLVAPEKTADRMTALRMLETGEYNYNDRYGKLFRAFFYGVKEAVRKDRNFLKSFIHLVRKVRYEQIFDPESRELVSDGSTLILRQCLYKEGGMFDYTILSNKLAVEVAAMVHAPDNKAMQANTGLDACLAGLQETMDRADLVVSITVDDSLAAMPETVQETCKRMLVPLNGAVRYLLKQPGYLSVFRNRVKTIQIQQGTSIERKGCRFQNGDLIISGLPGSGVQGWLPGDDLAAAIDTALFLRVRADILILEGQISHQRTKTLQERFGWDVSVEVDWEAFLAHPEQGGNRLSPIYVEQHGTETMVYALVTWMEDETFRERVSQRISTIRITSAPDIESKEIFIEGNKIVYRWFADISIKGYFSHDEIQQHLYRLIIKESD